MLNLQVIRTGVLHFFQEGIWYLNDAHGWRARVLKPLRILVLTVQGFIVDKSAFQASALTFYTLFAVVPILAVLFGLAQGFGLDDQLEKWLLLNMTGSEEIITRVVAISRNLLENTRSGVMAGVAVVLLLWSALKVLDRIETIFNQIWKVASRSMIRKFTDYLTILIIGPLLVVISSSLNIYITAHVAAFSKEVPLLGMAGPVVFPLLKLLPYGLIWVAFILVYLVIPNTRVKIIPAVIGGFVAGAVFQLVQGGYVNIQILLSRYNAIYGSFAALPLLLIWIQLSWIIVLFGAQLAYAHQHVGRHAVSVDYSRISVSLRKKYALYIYRALVLRFRKGDVAQSMQELAEELDLSYGIVARTMDSLIHCGLVSAVVSDTQEDTGYQPARDINAIFVSDVLQALDKVGDDGMPERAGEDFQRIFDAVETLSGGLRQSPADRMVKDI